MSTLTGKKTSIESLKLRIGDYQAHYLKAGSGPPVVLLHGGASDSRDWLGTMDDLSDRYSLYAPDLIGYGLSDSPRSGYYLSDFVEFTVGFIQALGLDSPVLVGHSWGGRVGLEIAARCPESIRRLALIDTLGFGRLARWGSLLGTLAWGVRKLQGHEQPYPALLKKDGENTDWICLDELPGLRVPTLIVWKRYDPYFPVASAIRAGRLIPRTRLVILPGYGHAPHKGKDNAFTSLLLGFLDHD